MILLRKCKSLWGVKGRKVLRKVGKVSKRVRGRLKNLWKIRERMMPGKDRSWWIRKLEMRIRVNIPHEDAMWKLDSEVA